MSINNFDVFMPVFILMLLGVLIVVGSYIASHFLSPKQPNRLKETPYECGEQPIGTAWSAFHVRFYVVGLIFIIFDVESALMFPVAVVFKRFASIGEGLPVLIIFLLFVSLLIEGIVYCWKKGDLDWVRSFQTPKK